MRRSRLPARHARPLSPDWYNRLLLQLLVPFVSEDAHAPHDLEGGLKDRARVPAFADATPIVIEDEAPRAREKSVTQMLSGARNSSRISILDPLSPGLGPLRQAWANA